MTKRGNGVVGKIPRLVFSSVFIAFLTAVLLEVGLRIAPSLIPMFLLIHFNEDLQSEIAFRLDYPSKSNHKTIPRDDGGPILWLPMPGQTVSWKFRDPGVVNRVVMDWRGFCNPPEKCVRDFRSDIVAVGDSFTWCTAMKPEDAWPSRVSDLAGTSTYNLSRGGMGLYEYVKLLKAFGLDIRPRVVILNVYEGNDLHDALKYHRHRYKAASEFRRGSEGKKKSVKLSPLGRLFFALLESRSGRYSYALNLAMTATNTFYV